MDIESSDPDNVKREFRNFSRAYFSSFNKTPFGMQRVVGRGGHPYKQGLFSAKMLELDCFACMNVLHACYFRILKMRDRVTATLLACREEFARLYSSSSRSNASCLPRSFCLPRLPLVPDHLLLETMARSTPGTFTLSCLTHPCVHV